MVRDEKSFDNAIGKLTKKGIILDDINSTELNPVFLQYDFKQDFFNKIPVQKVMDLFNKYYRKENYNDFTFLDVKEALIKVDGENVEKYHQYKKDVAKLKYDIDIELLEDETSVYISVYLQLYKELDLKNADLSDYEVIKQIAINNNCFSDGNDLFIYDIEKASFSTLENKDHLFTKKIFSAIIKNYDSLVNDLIKVPDLIEKYKCYYENEEVFRNYGAYESIKRIIETLKKA